jgi:hypothetical protein
MARKICIGNGATPEPLFVVTDNEGTQGEVVIQHIYAPTSATQRGNMLDSPNGSVTYDATSGLPLTWTGAAWA